MPSVPYIATVDKAGELTPEGIHRDEVDFGAIDLISRSNTEGRYSRIYDKSRKVKSSVPPRVRIGHNVPGWPRGASLGNPSHRERWTDLPSAMSLDLAYIYTPGLSEFD